MTEKSVTDIEDIGLIESLTKLTKQQLNSLKRLNEKPFEHYDEYIIWLMSEVYPYTIGQLPNNSMLFDSRFYYFLIKIYLIKYPYWNNALWFPAKKTFTRYLIALFSKTNRIIAQKLTETVRPNIDVGEWLNAK